MLAILGRIAVADRSVRDSTFPNDLFKLHSPPAGGNVERDRLEYYVTRASRTRLPEFSPDDHEVVGFRGTRSTIREAYSQALDKLFKQRSLPIGFRRQDVMDDDGLRKDVFRKALAKIKPKSNPGYPLCYIFDCNSDVDPDLLYACVDSTIKSWENVGHEALSQLNKREAFERMLSWPAMLFTKQEPTKEDKIARLIFGVSLVMNIIGRIFFGDYVDGLTESWRNASHKVGMDFNTEEGIRSMFYNYDRLRHTAYQFGTRVKSSDIQGWEWMVRKWMDEQWYITYLSNVPAGLGSWFQFNMVLCYMHAEHLAVLIDSDGFAHDLPFFQVNSGKFLTHATNSDERAALAEVVNLTFDVDTFNEITNGDDCNEVEGPNSLTYSQFGFVVTDVNEMDDKDRFDFCTQIFLRNGDTYKRIPDGLAKSLYNAICADNEESLHGIYSHVRMHPGFEAFVEFVEACDSWHEPDESADGQ